VPAIRFRANGSPNGIRTDSYTGDERLAQRALLSLMLEPRSVQRVHIGHAGDVAKADLGRRPVDARRTQAQVESNVKADVLS
jgi:hypothetical protein